MFWFTNSVETSNLFINHTFPNILCRNAPRIGSHFKGLRSMSNIPLICYQTLKKRVVSSFVSRILADLHTTLVVWSRKNYVYGENSNAIQCYHNDIKYATEKALSPVNLTNEMWVIPWKGLTVFLVSKHVIISLS